MNTKKEFVRISRLVLTTVVLAIGFIGCDSSAPLPTGPPSSPGAFSISGAMGGSDATPDHLLSNGTEVTVAWVDADGEDSYDVTIYESSGATVCATANVAAESTVYTFSGCALSAGSVYEINIMANRTGAAPTSASNDMYVFAVANVPTKLVLSGASPIAVGNCIAYTVTLQDSGDTPTFEESDRVVNLTKDLSGTFYSDSACTIPVTQVTITALTSSQTFHFKDSVEETVTLTASSAPLAAGNLAVINGVPFTDQTVTSGLSGANNTSFGGVAWGDYDNDGYFDLYVNGTGLFKNNGDGTFSPGPSLSNGSRAAHWGDYNNDGYLDFFATWNPYVSLNNGDGTFTLQSNAAIGITGYSNLGDISFLDYDHDGDLDVFAPDGTTGNFIYENNGDGTFTTIGPNALGLTPSGNGEAVVVADFDGDSYADILYRFGNGPLWRANGDGTFTDVAASAGLSISGDYIGTVFGDYDNDGDLDLFVGMTGTDILYRNNGDGTFTDVTSTAGVGGPSSLTRAVSFGDFDNDGDLDLFAGRSGSSSVWRNNGDGTFTDVAAIKGLADASTHVGAVWADYDNDGDLDIFVLSSSSKLYRNDLGDTNYLKVRVTGLGSGFSPVDGTGARVELYDATGTTLYAVREISGGEGMGSHSPRIQHFGLAQTWGGASGTYTVKVRFTSGITTVVSGVVPGNSSIVMGSTTLSQTIQVNE